MPAKVNFDGLHKFQQKLEEATRPQRFQLDELMTSSFMRAHTGFSSLSAMQDASGIDAPDPQSFVDSDAWNHFVANTTSFATWKEMLAAAYTEHLQRSLLA